MSQELDCRPAHIRKALDRGEFSLLFQPRFDLYRQSVSALEALVRWKRPGLHTPGPDVFIPLLEESGAIHELGHWVLDRSCARLRDWKDRGVICACRSTCRPYNAIRPWRPVFITCWCVMD